MRTGRRTGFGERTRGSHFRGLTGQGLRGQPLPRHGEVEAAAASPGRPPAKHPSRGGPPLAARDTGRRALRNFESERPPAQLLGDSGGPSLCRAALGTAAPASTTCYSWPIPSPRPSAPELYPHSPGPPRGAEDEDVPQRRAGQAAPATSALQPREAHKHEAVSCVSPAEPRSL